VGKNSTCSAGGFTKAVIRAVRENIRQNITAHTPAGRQREYSTKAHMTMQNCGETKRQTTNDTKKNTIVKTAKGERQGMNELKRAKEKLNSIIEREGAGEGNYREEPWYLEELYLEEVEAARIRRLTW